MSLRARLLAGMVVLVTVGLAVAALVTYEEQRSFLLRRVDQQVQSALVPLSFALQAGGRDLRRFRARLLQSRAGGRPRVAPPGVRPPSALPPGTFGEVLGPTGVVVRRQTFSYGEAAAPAPGLPAHPPLSSAGRPLRLFTVHTRDGTRYRAAAFPVGRDTVVAAVPLREVDDTLHRLVIVELLVVGGVVVALVALGWIVIRVGLRPLERIGRVASEIAGGDLSRRVEPTDPRTEVGRLGRSLNEMLGQIEQAFADRSMSEERLRRFLADASHELRTPLASIRGYAELFRLGAADDPDTLGRSMARIESEATRMGVLVEDLLLLARLDQAPPPRRESVDLTELAQGAAHDARAIGPGREVTVRAEAPATVCGDPDQLRQLLSNLIGNAVIHSPAGTAIEIAVQQRGNLAWLSVRDHGPGLPDDAGDQLFERFWRGEAGRQRGPGGAGLGLAIVRAVAAAHGGEAHAGNAPGGGARFTVSLPASEPTAPSQQTLSVLTSDSYLHRSQ